jgi:Cu/Ag efflux protein CusF
LPHCSAVPVIHAADSSIRIPGAFLSAIPHEPLTNLDMPAMTMVFRVNDRTTLEKVKEGDKIHVVAERVEGAITVVEWEASQ